MADPIRVFNGIDGSTGEYLLSLDRGRRCILGACTGSPAGGRRRFRGGPKAGVDVKDLAESGWGIVFAQGADRAEYQALAILRRHRQAQTGRGNEHLYQEYLGERGVRPGETARHWLTRHGAGPGPADPRQVPYYLLLVGDPQAIPFDFQFDLSVGRAVGRLAFERGADYRHYAANLVRVEEQRTERARRVVLFGVSNQDDPPTSYSCQSLVSPLFTELQRAVPWGWGVEKVPNQEATKDRLAELLGGQDVPAFLFTASHGLGFPCDHPKQRGRTGALLCQDWPGPRGWQGGIPPQFYFAADDLSPQADLEGLITFHFACFSAGMPAWDSFAHEETGEPKRLAPAPFVARLPQMLLGKPHGGAAAAIGHVDRARGFSFSWPGAGSQTQVFYSMVQRLLAGFPVGAAMLPFADRHAELAGDLSQVLIRELRGEPMNEEEKNDLRTAYIDARSWVVLGDPAVRVATGECLM